MTTSTALPDLQHSGQFLRFWLDITQAGHVTLVAIVPDGRTTTCTFETGEIDRALLWIDDRQREHHNLYFQPNETRPDCAKKPGKADIVALLSRFADIDPADEHFPLPDERDRLMHLAKHLIADPSFSPTVIIDSGNGIQPIWATERQNASADVIAEVEAETQSIEAILGAGGTHNVDRLLRLPGTLNFPNAKKQRLGRTISCARAIHCGANLYTIGHAKDLAAHLSKALSGTALVRPKPQQQRSIPSGIDPDAETESLVKELLKAGCAAIKSEADLPIGLRERLSAARKKRKQLNDRWHGLVDDLTERNLDDSRSGADFSLAAMTKAAGFSVFETALILFAYPHGKINTGDRADMAAALRHAARCALRSHTPQEPKVVRSADKTEWGEGNEDGTARAFAAAYDQRFVFDHTAGHWLVWQQGRWAVDKRSSVSNTARDFVRDLRDKLNNPPAGMARIAFAANVEKASRADPRLAVSQDVWDADPWVLGVPGGVVDLRTGQIGDAAPALYIARQASVRPAPAGTAAPLWADFLAFATGQDAELVGFLQRLCGYILTGAINEEMLAFVYGPGGNGKGVFLGALTAILGDYAVSVPLEVFTAGSRINLEYYRAQMAGARLVVASETEAQATWAESQIKEMTGNETPLSARHPYGKPFTFRPQFKIVLVGNHAPKLRGRSPAMERRLRVVPFTLVPAKPDPSLKDRLKAEYPAILRWMIDGCVMWQGQGLGSAQAIQDATGAYFERQDALQHWLEERCNFVPTMSTKPGALLADYNTWARENGEEQMTSNAFSESISRVPGLSRQKSGGVRLIRGIGLRSPYGDGRDD